MKKFRGLVLAAAFGALSVLQAMSAFAAQGSISFSDPEVNVGDEVNVSMKITADEGTALNSANIILTYPSGSLEFISGTDAEGGAGAIRVHGASNGKGTDRLEYNLRFRTAGAGTFPVSIDSYEVYDADDNPIEFTHLGSSAVTVKAAQNASSDCSLSALDVYPGTLEPSFSPENTTYNVSVGLNVSRLTINAITTDGSANVRISGNDELPEGDSSIIVTVNAADGNNSLDYIINVSKAEGGPDTGASSGEQELADGVQLSSKGKTITIMNPGEDVEVPEGFRQGTISIDDQKVQGWVWGADEEPEYCVVYGMNDKGEINFYRYDMVEKTIQRYFEDPISANAVTHAEYEELEAAKAQIETKAETRLIIMAVIAVAAFAMFMACIYMWVRLRTSEKLQKTYRKQSIDRYGKRADSQDAEDREAQSGSGLQPRKYIRQDAEGTAGKTGELPAGQTDDGMDSANELLKHDYSSENAGEAAQTAADETQVIRRHDRKRRARRNRLSDADTAETGQEETPELSAEQNESPEKAVRLVEEPEEELFGDTPESDAESDE